MKKTSAFLIIMTVMLSITFFSCRKERDPKPERNSELVPVITTTKATDLQTLGRVLFYDKVLSVNNVVACASCHKQELAFSDNVAFSTGFSGKPTLRNSMPIHNINTFGGFFWDMRTQGLEEMVLQPVENHIEMGFDKVGNIIKKIEATDYYEPLFTKAFNSAGITEIKIRQALVAFLTSLRSEKSRYDDSKLTNFANFTADEHRGLKVYRELHCNNCHNEHNNFLSWSGAVGNIGLEKNYKDKGVASMGEGNFKVPSLKNIALTGPYMHDGRFKTLEEVIEHYNSGVVDHPNLSWALIDENKTTGVAKKLNLSNSDKKALVAFLKTLTDKQFITNPDFSNPFRPKN